MSGIVLRTKEVTWPTMRLEMSLATATTAIDRTSYFSENSGSDSVDVFIILAYSLAEILSSYVGK